MEASQLGATIVQTLLPGVHAGATAKYVWATPRVSIGDPLLPPEDLLDRGDDLDGGDTDSAFGLDVGLIGVGGPLRLGLLIRNAVEAEIEDVAGGARFEFARQYRVGFAYDAERAGGTPLTVALDADVSTLATGTGDRRNIALGAEQWLLQRRLGLRGGARFNTVGAKERAVTGGVSVAVRAGFFVDAHIVGGGNDDDRGWGAAARVSF